MDLCLLWPLRSYFKPEHLITSVIYHCQLAPFRQVSWFPLKYLVFRINIKVVTTASHGSTQL